MAADHDASMVGNVGHSWPLCRQLSLASQFGEALGRGLLDMRCGNNGLRYAEPSQVTAPPLPHSIVLFCPGSCFILRFLAFGNGQIPSNPKDCV